MNLYIFSIDSLYEIYHIIITLHSNDNMYNYYYKNYWMTAIQEPTFYYTITPLSNHYRYLYIDTTLSVTSLHSYMHPLSPRPTRYKQFIFSVGIYPLSYIRKK